MNRTARQLLVFVLSSVALGSVFATAGYFYSDATEEATENRTDAKASVNEIAKIAKPLVISLSDIPDVNQALSDLFSLPAQDSKIKTAKDKLASLWFQQSFEDGGNKYHSVFIKNQMVDVETDEVYGNHSDAPIISAVVYKRIQDKWELISKQKNIGTFGSWGDAPSVNKAELLQLAKGNTALLLDISYSGQGLTNKGKSIFSYHNESWSLLGFLQTGGDNEGVCDEDAKKDELLFECWRFNGKISLSENSEDDVYPDVVISRSGTMSDKNGNVIPVTNSIYSFNGEEYLIDEIGGDDDDMDEDDEIE